MIKTMSNVIKELDTYTEEQLVVILMTMLPKMSDSVFNRLKELQQEHPPEEFSSASEDTVKKILEAQRFIVKNELEYAISTLGHSFYLLSGLEPIRPYHKIEFPKPISQVIPEDTLLGIFSNPDIVQNKISKIAEDLLKNIDHDEIRLYPTSVTKVYINSYKDTIMKRMSKIIAKKCCEQTGDDYSQLTKVLNEGRIQIVNIIFNIIYEKFLHDFCKFIKEIQIKNNYNPTSEDTNEH